MIDFQQIEAIHEQVRKFVEEQEPEYKVTGIDEYTTTTYMPTMQSQWEVSPVHAIFVLVEIKVRFRVEACYLANPYKKLSCEIQVLPDGMLMLTDHTVRR